MMIGIGIVCLIVGLLFGMKILGIGEFVSLKQICAGWVFATIGLFILLDESGIVTPKTSSRLMVAMLIGLLAVLLFVLTLESTRSVLRK